MKKKHIYIYSPSGAVNDRAAFRRGVRRLQHLGHEVEIDSDALTRHMRFAGDDATRLAAIHRAAASGADAALISRGGYGMTRILGDIHYKTVAKAIERGMHFIGLSDFTAFQLAVLRKTGSVTWAGPALCEGFGVAAPLEPNEIMESCFNELLAAQAEGVGWRQNKESNSLDPANLQEKIIYNALLWGGNLSLVSSLVGTPFFPEIKGGILLLEDVGEHPYQVERMLSQLLHAGILDRQKAVLMGQFTNYKLSSHDRGFKLQKVLEWLRTRIKTPVLTNLPYGHVATKVLLPIGAKVDLAIEKRNALLVWGHLKTQ